MNRLLDHIHVLDLSRLLPGAYCTQLLADLGAQVLKVEEPGVGDYMRQLNPWVFNAINRNKKSIVIDIKKPKGREILVQLIRTHDVLLECFRPGVMERLGLGYEDVKQTNPGIIYCSMSGYGQSGPYKKRSGHDLNYVAVAGVLGLTSDPTELPKALPLPLADLTGGLMASHAILASLMGKSKSGKGCYLDVAMMDAALSLMSIRIAIAFGTGKTARHQLLRGGAYDSYRTKDGRFITLGVIEDKFWRNLARALRKEELTQDPRFSTDRSRMENRQLVREILEPILGGRNLEEWIAKFEEEDVPSAPVNRLEELEVDPQIRHRGMLFNLPDDAGRDCRLVGYPALFQGYESLKDQPAPGMGQDTYQILSALGFRESEITFMVQEGVVSVLEKKEQRVLWS